MVEVLLYINIFLNLWVLVEILEFKMKGKKK